MGNMKIAQLMTGTNLDLENRKRALQRREVGDAYKKNAQYQSKKNPMLEVLENLLSGKTEKDLHAADQAKREFGAPTSEQENSFVEQQKQKLEQPEVKAEIKELELTEKEVIVHEQAHKAVGGSVTGPITYTHTEGPDGKRYINGGEVSIHMKEGATPEETLEILEKVKAAALAPAEPSPQDLRVAASATAQIQQTRAGIAKQNVEQLQTDEEEVEPFAGVGTNVEVPERFMNNFEQRDATQGTLLFGRELESLLYERTFKQASMKYSSHIDMVKNGYRSFDEPTFSKTA